MYLRKKLRPSASKGTRDAAYEAALEQYKKVQAKLANIEKAISDAGLYAMEHGDGTFSVERK